MKLEQIPKDLRRLELEEVCEVDGCWTDASEFYATGTEDVDAMLTWSLCDKHGEEYSQEETQTNG